MDCGNGKLTQHALKVSVSGDKSIERVKRAKHLRVTENGFSVDLRKRSWFRVVYCVLIKMSVSIMSKDTLWRQEDREDEKSNAFKGY